MGSAQPASNRIAEAKPYPADLLLEAADLAKPEVAKRLRFLDTRSRADYLAGHIPGALWVDHLRWGEAFAAGPDVSLWATKIANMGVKHNTPLVIYDEGPPQNAAHVWWILRYWGFEEVSLLNGGWNAWQAAGGGATRDVPSFPPKVIKLRPAAYRLADKSRVLESMYDKQVQIIDARSSAESGGWASPALQRGDIPSAKHLDASAVVDAQTGCFKSAKEVQEWFNAAGIDLARPSITYGQEIDRPTLMAFTLELMGAKNVRVYYRGWPEWAAMNRD
jgi:thiosulfate/3-mercaptopyruvate sulfurtransferase